eukprot:11122741-Lingulodinium_polyedra.AAC.1
MPARSGTASGRTEATGKSQAAPCDGGRANGPDLDGHRPGSAGLRDAQQCEGISTATRQHGP